MASNDRDNWSDSCGSYNLRPGRPLTGATLETYKQTKEKYENALDDINKEVCGMVDVLQATQCSFSDIKANLLQRFDQYEKTSELYSRYIKTTRHLDCEQELNSNNIALHKFQQFVHSVFQKYDSVKESESKSEHVTETKTETSKSELEKTVIDTTTERQDFSETPTTKPKVITNQSVPVKAERSKSTKSKSLKMSIRSKLSGLSKHSSRSSDSELNAKYITQKAKVQELKVRMNYAKKEAELQKQKAEIEANMKVLNTEREFKECEQANKVLEEYFEDSSEKESDAEDENENLEQVQQDRVEKFIQEQSRLQEQVQDTNIKTPLVQHKSFEPTDVTGHINETSLNPNATPFVSANDTFKFMIKKDLLLNGLRKFNDTPEYFGSWKRSFIEKVKQLDLTETEEIDLLISHLGPESSKFAISISSANYNNTTNALKLIWERLHDRYARPEMIESSIKMKLTSFRRIGTKDYKRLYELVDVVTEIESVKTDPIFSSLFAYYDSSVGVNPVVMKLPYQLQEKWTMEAIRFKETNCGSYPPFSVFVEFLRKMARMKNDPSFVYDEIQPVSTNPRPIRSHPVNVSVRKTETQDMKRTVHVRPFHKANSNHTLNKCRMFRKKAIQERLDFVKSEGLCFKCCGEKPHVVRNCRASVLCEICNSKRHPTALHVDRNFNEPNMSKNDDQICTQRLNKTEIEQDTKQEQSQVTANCTEICKNPTGTSKSCSKTVLCRVYPKGDPTNSLLLYSIIDEHSNRSLASSSFFEHFNIQGPEMSYSLNSCSGRFTEYGRRVSGFVVEPVDGSSRLNLPTLIECDQIPNNRQEIPSRDVALQYPHLRDIAYFIPNLNDNADIMLLIGRDLLSVHPILDQRTGPPNLPFAQKIRLGWVIIGESCLSATHEQDSVSVMKTFTLKDGRTTSLEPCMNAIKAAVCDEPLFVRTPDDNQPGLSIDDKQFLSLMSEQIHRNQQGSWTAPLPFRENRKRLPNNNPQALRRAKTLDKNLKRHPEKQKQMLEFMEKILSNNHAELAPPLESESCECWYLPLFPVYHPKKPGSIRCVFDSSAKYEDISLNDVLLTGPDLINSLLGILIRFRQKPIAITADIEQMFYCFSVPPNDRNYLRFYWYQNNDPSQKLVEYRMTRHVFGNSASPAVATYGLRQSVANADSDIRDFVEQNLYVDDGLASFDSSQDAVDLVSRTQSTLLKEGNIRLHKISSNSIDVLKSFPEEDLSKEVKGINIELDQAPLQRSLGVIWDVSSDSFTFKVDLSYKPYTKRGVLSVINGLYDPLGFVAPVTIAGKIIMRDVMLQKTDWDETLSDPVWSRWNDWRVSLENLETLRIPRSYSSHKSTDIRRRELHIFSDSSKDAICAVAYLKLYDINGSSVVSFVHGKAKVAPTHGHTIPRLELCAAVLAVSLKDSILKHLTLPVDDTFMYTDSKIVLGYINNEQRRFYVYVGNRVDLIRQSTHRDQWRYVATEDNPADIATRSISVSDYMTSKWLLGPQFLLDNEKSTVDKEGYPLLNPEVDKEIRPEILTKKTVSEITKNDSISFFKKFSSWNRLVRTVARLKHIAKSFSNHVSNPIANCKGWHMCKLTSNDLLEAELFILKEAQNFYSKEITAIKEGRNISTSSSIVSLSPILDEKGLLRVSGRLEQSKDLSHSSKHPVIVPNKHHIALLLIRHIHELVFHQGRHITEGRIRLSGYWIVGCKRMVNTLIHNCVICKKLRGSRGTQIMADLPEDRISECPPFTFAGVDAFGPYNVIARKTRGGQANYKRWGILFTCLVIRAIHIEIVEELSSSSFINALRRFVAIRGPVRQFHSDRGTNFIAAANELGMNSICVEDETIRNFLDENRITWVFNRPHASHFGGAWERMIGVTRRILDAMLLRTHSKELTHEVLTTFMSEVCSVVNSRPLVPVSTDPDDASVLTPNILLTQKISTLPENLPTLNTKEVYKSQWKHVVLLSQEFWKKWREQYLSNLQQRRKWSTQSDDIKERDIVLLKDNDVSRTNWPMAIVERVFPSKDSHIRKVEIRVANSRKVYIRPIAELVPLLSV